MSESSAESQTASAIGSPLRNLCIIWFVIGLVASGGWVLAKSDKGKRVEKSTQLVIFMDDQKCDSGFELDWFDGASLIDLNGKKISELSFKGSSADCTSGLSYEFISMRIAVEPTEDWIYRLSIPNASDSNSRDLIAIDSLDPISGPAQVFFSMSLDCPAGVRVCL